jgi:hypothetical protein
MDETTPHMHFICTPIHDKGKKKGWGLSAKHFADGKGGLAKMQDSYHEHIVAAGHELDRGLKGSKSKHQSVKKFYAEIEKRQEESAKVSAELKASVVDLVGEESPSLFEWKRAAKLFEKLKQTCLDLSERLGIALELNVTLSAKNKQLEKELDDTKDATYGFINDLRSAYPSEVSNQQMVENMVGLAQHDGQRIKDMLEASKKAAEEQREKDMLLQHEQEKKLERSNMEQYGTTNPTERDLKIEAIRKEREFNHGSRSNDSDNEGPSMSPGM